MRLFPALAIITIYATLVGAAPVAAQDPALVEAVAPLLQAEDARDWRPERFRAGLESPEALVRRTAALAVGRVGDLRGTALLVPLLQDPDSSVQPIAAFALGLLRDSSALGPLIARLGALPAPTLTTAEEIITALARIGGNRAAGAIAGILDNSLAVSVTENRDVLVRQAALEAWRLGATGPARQLVALAQSEDEELRWRVVYSLARLRSREGGNVLVAALTDANSLARAFAARGLSMSGAEAMAVPQDAAVDLLSRAAQDDLPGVRINALRALGTYKRPALAERLAVALQDPVPNAQVAAAQSLGDVGGPAAVAQLARVARERRGSFALQREALLGLARIGADSFSTLAGAWQASPRWEERAAVAEGWGLVTGAGAGPGRIAGALADRDGRVVAAGLQGWADAVKGPDSALMSAARGLLDHPDASVRSVAADAIARGPVASDLPALTAAFHRAARDSFPDAALSALGALRALAQSSAEAASEVEARFINAVPRPSDYQVRAWAEQRWPAVSERWGPAYPVETGRTLDDYRDLARQFVVVPQSPAAYPHVFIETDQRGIIELELFGPEAPLTVSNFLSLVDRHFFDNGRWHRVVPNFVVQDGDPRGDGWGGPARAIRDEINPRKYRAWMVGMALSGPDTGGSQWFITLSPQPHLDGTYTVFGKVVSGTAALQRITQGDGIRTIRR
jgi:cyclophilin family peptidyl-prolyl cis-trans isomerase/HEAT repeat protein